MPPSTSRFTAERLGVLIAILATTIAVTNAVHARWVCDDAFISFRYADHLQRGLGLVYNSGERVEGYSNLLWTLWISLGLKLGVPAEAWAMGWGIAAYAGCILLLVRRAFVRHPAGSRSTAWPVAALIACVHPDWIAFSTGGLETSWFAFLVLLGFILLLEAHGRTSRWLAAGTVFGLAGVTRPEAPLLGVIAWVFVCFESRPRAVAAIAFGLPFAGIVAGQLIWRGWYYHDLLPNTYYAKSAGATWISQGWTYVALYAVRYPLTAVGSVLGLVAGAWAVSSPLRRATALDATREALLAGLLMVAYTVYIVRVGGDFMFARWMIHVTPLALILTEIAFMRMTPTQGAIRPALAALLVAGTAWGFHPLQGGREVEGIVDERSQYPPERCAALRHKGEELRRQLDGFPVRVAFMGGEARVIYYSQVSTAIECATGLTDRFIARGALTVRGRVGHEKRPSAAYLLGVRGVQLALHPGIARELGFADSVMEVPMRFGTARVVMLRSVQSSGSAPGALTASPAAFRGATMPAEPEPPGTMSPITTHLLDP